MFLHKANQNGLILIRVQVALGMSVQRLAQNIAPRQLCQITQKDKTYLTNLVFINNKTNTAIWRCFNLDYKNIILLLLS